MKNNTNWITYSIITVLFWGVWGAFINIPEENGFPATLGYVVWAFTAVLVALVSLAQNNWKLATDRNSIVYGLISGLLGASGQLMLFIALKESPAYLVFPLIALMPVVTVILAVLILKEKTGLFGWIGVALSIIAGILLAYSPPTGAHLGTTGLILSVIIMILWGVQGFVLKIANEKAEANAIFFYMITAAVLLIPVALYITDFSKPIYLGFKGPYLAFMIQILNSVGALFLVYAFRYGKSIIVAPATNALPPVITVLISLTLYQVIPHIVTISGIVLAVIAAVLMALDEVKEAEKHNDAKD